MGRVSSRLYLSSSIRLG